MNSNESYLAQISHRPSLRWVSPLLAALSLILSAHTVSADTLPVPNASFETPTAPGEPFDAAPFVDYWQQTPQPFYYTTNFTSFPWEDNIGVFTNDPADGAFIDNCDGVQGGFISGIPLSGIYQDYNSFSSTQTGPSHAFNARFKAGHPYFLRAGVIGDSPEGLPLGATLQMLLYYRDISNNMVTVASTTITNSTNLFPNNTHFVNFQVDVPTVQATDSWSGQNIGIEFIVPLDFVNNTNGFWDLDNVQLVEGLSVPNASFETPTAPGEPFDAAPFVDYWQQTPQPAYYTTNFTSFPWEDNIGVFTNDPADGAYIVNCDGVQGGFIAGIPLSGIYQDFNSFSSTQIGPTHEFNVTFTPGKAYTFTAGIIGDSLEGLPVGATLQMNLYYRDASNNPVTVAATTITNTAATFPDNTHFVDFSVTTPGVNATDAWAGQNLGIEFIVPLDFVNNTNGFWDVDNVRLLENPSPAVLVNPVLVNGQGNFGLQSAPGLAFNLLATTNISTPATNWISIGTVTNTSGALWITDPATNVNQRFYRARQL